MDKEEALIQSALERIARARAKGKTNVNLTQEEMEALERRRGQQPEQTPPLASPPATPAKNAKGIKAASRSSSTTSLASKTRKRGGSGLFGTNSTSPAKSNSKAKVNRKPSAERALPYPVGQAPAGVMVQGPDGQPFYAPIGYYGPPSPEFLRSQTRGSQPGSRSASRSASKHSRRESTPPERTAEYAQYPLRYLPPGGARPDSSGSNRSLPDDIEWHPPPPAGRNRSSSNVPYPPPYPIDYGGALLPAAQGRRNVSGPPDVQYSNLRRVPPSSPLAQRPVPAHASHSDPVGAGIMKRSSGLSQEVGGSSESSESSSSSDDQGVQVNIETDPTSPNGYSISRAPVPAASGAANPPSGNEGRRRKARR
jgi:PRA1 family protein 1